MYIYINNSYKRGIENDQRATKKFRTFSDVFGRFGRFYMFLSSFSGVWVRNSCAVRNNL